VYPRAATVSVANSAALYAADGAPIIDRIPIAAERVKVALAQGGATEPRESSTSMSVDAGADDAHLTCDRVSRDVVARTIADLGRRRPSRA